MVASQTLSFYNLLNWVQTVAQCATSTLSLGPTSDPSRSAGGTWTEASRFYSTLVHVRDGGKDTKCARLEQSNRFVYKRPTPKTMKK